MKKGKHPEYQDVLFVDSSTGHQFVCGSALKPEEKAVFQGVEYPVCRISISSYSHPFFTGSKQHLDAEGRVDKFMKRYATKEKKENTEQDAQQGEQGKEQKAAKEKKAKAPKSK